MKKQTKLFILDLDHTLIYASYEPMNQMNVLFTYGKYLYVLERPFARELVNLVQVLGDVMVFTSAKADYARRIIKMLHIHPIEVYTRQKCKRRKDTYLKYLPESIRNRYERISIIDDTYAAWPNASVYEPYFYIPKEYRGQVNDEGLTPIINSIQSDNE
jgi:RNA polymerase II subunit A small phosphatase-like protein